MALQGGMQKRICRVCFLEGMSEIDNAQVGLCSVIAA